MKPLYAPSTHRLRRLGASGNRLLPYAILILVACSQPSAPQEEFFTVDGVVLAPAGPVAGVLLSLSSGGEIGCSGRGPFRGRSDADGRFAIQASNPCRSLWRLEATHPNYYQIPYLGEVFSEEEDPTGLIVTMEPFGPLTITTASLPAATVNVLYSASLEATGNPTLSNGGASWSVVSGSLPPGIALDIFSTLRGYPTTPGTWTFTLRVQTVFEDVQEADEASLSIVVNP